jgi:hypothetical protein
VPGRNRQPLETIFAERAGIADRARWLWSALAKRLERLPPLWTAYALTLTEAVGSTILALPIALAMIGPLPGVAILVMLGLVNVLTVAFLAEAITRSGTMRYGSASSGASSPTTSVAAARSWSRLTCSCSASSSSRSVTWASAGRSRTRPRCRPPSGSRSSSSSGSTTCGGGQAVLPLTHACWRVEITLPKASSLE